MFIYALLSVFFFFFFFSSRRRHTRLVSDWSSDVCSSDLRAPGARFDVLPLRQVRFRARSEADARRAPALARLLPGGASADVPGGRARRDTVRGQDALRSAAKAGGLDGTLADIDHGAGPGFDQGGAARLRGAVPRAGDRDPRDRRTRAGRGGG